MKSLRVGHTIFYKYLWLNCLLSRVFNVKSLPNLKRRWILWDPVSISRARSCIAFPFRLQDSFPLELAQDFREENGSLTTDCRCRPEWQKYQEFVLLQCFMYAFLIFHFGINLFWIKYYANWYLSTRVYWLFLPLLLGPYNTAEFFLTPCLMTWLMFWLIPMNCCIGTRGTLFCSKYSYYLEIVLCLIRIKLYI